MYLLPLSRSLLYVLGAQHVSDPVQQRFVVSSSLLGVVSCGCMAAYMMAVVRSCTGYLPPPLTSELKGSTYTSRLTYLLRETRGHRETFFSAFFFFEEKPGLWTYRELIGTQISISHPTTAAPPPERNRIGVYRTTITKVTHEYHHNANR